MMHKEKILTLAAAAAVLIACGREPIPENRIELRLTSGIGMSTRADYTPTQSTALATGENVYAWVDDAGDATHAPAPHVEAWALISNAGGSLTGANKYYFPASGRTVDVYAVHGNFTAPIEGTTGWSAFTPVVHQVFADQSETTANYEHSDFLFARDTTIVRDNNPKVLDFKHILSKIEIHLIAGTGLVGTDITGATVKVRGLVPTATVTLNKRGQPDATVVPSGTPTDIQCRMTYKDDVMVGTEHAYAFAEAIVVPQVVSTPVSLLEITLPNSGIVLTTALGTYTFEKGKRYGYNVTVNAKNLLLESTITDWTDSGTSDISAD